MTLPVLDNGSAEAGELCEGAVADNPFAGRRATVSLLGRGEAAMPGDGAAGRG